MWINVSKAILKYPYFDGWNLTQMYGKLSYQNLRIVYSHNIVITIDDRWERSMTISTHNSKNSKTSSNCCPGNHVGGNKLKKKHPFGNGVYTTTFFAYGDIGGMVYWRWCTHFRDMTENQPWGPGPSPPLFRHSSGAEFSLSGRGCSISSRTSLSSDQLKLSKKLLKFDIKKMAQILHVFSPAKAPLWSGFGASSHHTLRRQTSTMTGNLVVLPGDRMGGKPPGWVNTDHDWGWFPHIIYG